MSDFILKLLIAALVSAVVPVTTFFLEQGKSLRAYELKEIDAAEVTRFKYLEIFINRDSSVEDRVLIMDLILRHPRLGDLKGWVESNLEVYNERLDLERKTKVVKLRILYEESINRLDGIEEEVGANREKLASVKERKENTDDEIELANLSMEEEEIEQFIATNEKEISALIPSTEEKELLLRSLIAQGEQMQPQENMRMQEVLRNFSDIEIGMTVELESAADSIFKFRLYDKKPTNFGTFGAFIGKVLMPGSRFKVNDKNKVGLRRYAWIEIEFRDENNELVTGWYSWENVLSKTLLVENVE